MSAEETSNVQRVEPEGGLSGVGKRLAAARKEQERELASVASDLHLNVEVVSALEAGDESGLPAVTFVRGYIKSYARLLGLDEKQLLGMLPATEGYQPAPLKSVSMRRPQLDLPLGKWLFWLIALGVLITLVIYGIPVVERLVSRTEQTVEKDALPLPLEEQPQEMTSDMIPVVPEASEPRAIAEPVEPLAEPDVELEKPTAAVAAPPALPDQSEAVPDESESVPDEPEAAPEEAEAAPEEAQVAGPAVIILRFNEDSWVEMESHGRKLVVGTQPAGSERTIRAEPPVQILLGNAPGVVLEYRGKAVDLEPYRRGKVARLVLED